MESNITKNRGQRIPTDAYIDNESHTKLELRGSEPNNAYHVNTTAIMVLQMQVPVH